MNLQQNKRLKVFISIHDYFVKYGEVLTASVPGFVPLITRFETLFNHVWESNTPIMDNEYTMGGWKNELKEQCIQMVWKLASAMKYHFAITGNIIEADNIKMTEARLKKLSENDFYTYGQMVMNLYEPAVYVPLGISEAEGEALRAKLLNFPNSMRAVKETRLKLHKAIEFQNDLIKDMGHLLKHELDPMMETVKNLHERIYLVYKDFRRIGLVSPTRGKPHRQGTLAPGQLLVIDKHPYRRKRALYVCNTGNSQLLAGIGLIETELHGTPFSIEPGQTRQRVSLKLAPKGEYFLLYNAGTEETGYEVWMKEG